MKRIFHLLLIALVSVFGQAGWSAEASAQNGLSMTRYGFHGRSINFEKAEKLSEPVAPEVALLSEKTAPQYPHEFAESPLVEDDHNLFWAAKFTGSLVPPQDGEYVFQITADEYASLIIGGNVLINQYGERAGLTTESEPITLKGGEPAPVLVEYWNVLGPSFLRISWKKPGSTEFEQIPRDAWKPQQPVSPVMATSVRFFPAEGKAEAMVGGKFTGSLTSPTNDFEAFATIESAPKAGEWNTITVEDPQAYRYIKYEAPAGTHGAIAELEFYNGDQKLTGEGFGTAGSRDDSGNTWEKALDGDTKTVFEGMETDHQYVGIDLGEDAQAPQPTISRMDTESKAQTFVKIDVPEGTFVRYTISPDRSYQTQTDPTLLQGEMYTGPFAIAQDRTIMARAFDMRRAPSQRAVQDIPVEKIEMKEGYTSLHTGNSLMGGLKDFIPMIAASAGIDHTMEGVGAAGAPTDFIWKTDNLRKRARDWIDEHSPNIYVPQPFARDPGTESYWEMVGFKHVLEQNPEAKLMIYMQWPNDDMHTREYSNILRLQKLEADKTLDGEEWPVDPADYTKPDETVTDDKKIVGWRGKSLLLPEPENWRDAMMNYTRSYEMLYEMMDKQFPDKHVSVIPAGLALVAVYDAVVAGEMPGVDAEVGHKFFFADGLHLNPTGQYISALTHFACFYQKDPAGNVSSAGSGMSPEQALKVQQCVWKAIQDYPYSSINVD